MRRRWIIAGSVLCALLFGLYAAGWAAVNIRQGGHYFFSNGVPIYYTDRGAGEPVILLHGFGLTSRLAWELRGVSGPLAKKYRVIAPDHRGHGRSSILHMPANYGEEMVRDVLRLMDELKIPKAHIVGYSMGGFIALKFATMFPDRVLSAAVCGAGFEEGKGKNLDALKDLAKSLRANGDYTPLLRVLEPNGAEPARFKVMLMNWIMKRQNDPIALAAVAEAFPQFAVTAETAKACKIPMISIVGAEDPLRTGVEALHKLVPGHELVVVPNAHHFNTVGSAQFRNTLLDFLARHAAAPEAAPPKAAEAAHAPA